MAGRYHSLVVDPALPDCLERSAYVGGVVMGIRHRELPAEGVQFHPESVLTGAGKRAAAEFPRCAPGRAGSFRSVPVVTNPVLTEAIDRLAGREALTEDQTSRGAARGHGGTRRPRCRRPPS